MDTPERRAIATEKESRRKDSDVEKGREEEAAVPGLGEFDFDVFLNSLPFQETDFSNIQTNTMRPKIYHHSKGSRSSTVSSYYGSSSPWASASRSATQSTPWGLHYKKANSSASVYQ